MYTCIMNMRQAHVYSVIICHNQILIRERVHCFWDVPYSFQATFPDELHNDDNLEPGSYHYGI